MLKQGFITKEFINKGWSKDKKYRLLDEQGTTFLLRVSQIEEYEHKKLEYNLMKKVASLHIPMCLPLEFGVFEESVYLIQTWIEGTEAEKIMYTLSNHKQYAYGLKAGNILKKIHTIPAPKNIEDWDLTFNRKIDRIIQAYQKSPIQYNNDEAFINYINAHRHLLKKRPQTYQHGDYHIGNMIIGEDKLLYIIDFNRSGFGDPWEEFNRIVWCAKTSPLFATGMIDGYFDNHVPIMFWKLLALYISCNTLSSIPWAIPFGQHQVQIMTKQAEDVLNWYENMSAMIPNWYHKVNEK